MNCPNLTPSVSGTVLALLPPSESLTSSVLLAFGPVHPDMLLLLKGGMNGAGIADVPEFTSDPTYAASEYASWMPDPVAIEVASWGAHLRVSVS